MARWVRVAGRDSGDIKTYPAVNRYYWKGRELCLELAALAPDGNPLIIGHPEVQIAYTERPRVPQLDDVERWVEIILRDSMSAKRHIVVGYEWRGLELSLSIIDHEGKPIILGYPEGRIFSIARSHLPHAGMEERKGKDNG